MTSVLWTESGPNNANAANHIQYLYGIYILGWKWSDSTGSGPTHAWDGIIMVEV